MPLPSSNIALTLFSTPQFLLQILVALVKWITACSYLFDWTEIDCVTAVSVVACWALGRVASFCDFSSVFQRNEPGLVAKACSGLLKHTGTSSQHMCSLCTCYVKLNPWHCIIMLPWLACLLALQAPREHHLCRLHIPPQPRHWKNSYCIASA